MNIPEFYLYSKNFFLFSELNLNESNILVHYIPMKNLNYKHNY